MWREKGKSNEVALGEGVPSINQNQFTLTMVAEAGLRFPRSAALQTRCKW